MTEAETTLTDGRPVPADGSHTKQEARHSAIRCVYINNTRIVGNKPYVSEDLPQWSRKFTIDDLRHAFPEFEITPKPDPRPQGQEEK